MLSVLSFSPASHLLRVPDPPVWSGRGERGEGRGERGEKEGEGRGERRGKKKWTKGREGKEECMKEKGIFRIYLSCSYSNINH